MLLGGCALIGGLIWLPLGQWLALGAWLPLSWINNVATILSQPAWAVIPFPTFSLWVLVIAYTAIAGIWWRWLRTVV
jgi:competence protein ComEC